MALLLLGTLGLVAFGALAWVVLLASVAALHAKYQEFNDITSVIGDDDVSDILGLPWWMVWYHFLLLVAVAVVASMGMLRQYAHMLGNFLTALFAVQMYNTHRAAVSSRAANRIDFDSALESRSNAFLAGCILSALSTALLIVWLGMVPSFGNDSVDKADPANQTQMKAQLSYGTPAPPAHGLPPAGMPQYNAPTATGSSHGGGPQIPAHAPPPGVPPGPQQHGYNHLPPAPLGGAAAAPPPPPPVGATNYGQQPY